MSKWAGLVLILVLVLCLGFGFFFISRKGAGVIYEGVLPGADCAGLKTELTLYENNTYYLKETYLATRDGDKTFTSFGRWRTLPKDIIQLDFDQPGKETNYRILPNSNLCLIGKDLKAIDCPFNLILELRK